MKRHLKMITAIVVTGILATSSMVMAAEGTYGSAGAVADDSFTLEEMMVYAIQDEYFAQAEYVAIMDAFGSQRPFSNIVLSEKTHIALLLPLFETYEFAVPVNDAESKVVLADTLLESYNLGVDAEIKNIAMYEAFLKEDLPEDVRAVFERLQAASENHLRAFENAAAGTMGNGGSKDGSRGNGKAGKVGRGSCGGSGRGTMSNTDCIL